MNETVFALASAPGRSGVAVIRLSGPQAATVIKRLTGWSDLPRPRHAARCALADPKDKSSLDDGLVLWFPGPASFTGEDVAELHIHGGRATVEAVSEVLAGEDQVRLAEPGEFSRRAFLNGKMDLVEAEAISDLVDADTDFQRRQALRQMRGGLSGQLEGWRSTLVGIMAHLEAWIDFPDEDLPEATASAARAEIGALEQTIRGFLDDNRRGERLRAGLHVAIVGAPNSGKSSLLNVLSERDAAIVSATAGTTRDVVEVHLDLGGWPVTLADTAGLRSAPTEIEREGVRRAYQRADEADLKIVVFDVMKSPDQESLEMIDDLALPVINKTDLRQASLTRLRGQETIQVSALTGAGLTSLLGHIEKRAAGMIGEHPEAPLTRLRHRLSLTDCADALARAVAGEAIELITEDLRVAATALGRVTGRVDVEDLLDVVFRDFCIGK